MIFFNRILTLADLKNPARGRKVKPHPETRETVVVAQPSISYILGKSEFSDSKPVGSNKEKNKINDKNKAINRQCQR